MYPLMHPAMTAALRGPGGRPPVRPVIAAWARVEPGGGPGGRRQFGAAKRTLVRQESGGFDDVEIEGARCYGSGGQAETAQAPIHPQECTAEPSQPLLRPLGMDGHSAR